eukprot:984627-Pelagomonas_calceolata.AAC.4
MAAWRNTGLANSSMAQLSLWCGNKARYRPGQQQHGTTKPVVRHDTMQALPTAAWHNQACGAA